MSGGAESLWLPPPDARLADPRIYKIDTPIDERGLIDVDLLIRAVKETVDPAYQWGSSLSIHHLYWPKNDYAPPLDEENTPHSGQAFRNLPIHKALVPRIFENWLHSITIPPPVPTQEVMHYRIESWSIIKELFVTARETVLHEKLARRRRAYVAANPEILKTEFNGHDEIGEEYIQSEFERYFYSWEYQRKRYQRIPEEFRLITLEDNPLEVASTLGKLIMPRSLQLVRAVNQ